MSDLSHHKTAQCLRIYIGEGDRWRGKALHSELLKIFQTHGMAGATVLRGLAGYGAHARLRSARLEVLSMDLPIVIEVVDTAEKIDALLEVIYPMIREGLITREPVEIIKYTHRYRNPLPGDHLVSEVMTKKVISLHPEQSIYDAWKQMLEKQVKANPVVDQNGKVLGIITDEDLLQRAGIQQRLSVAIRLEPEEINQELQTLQTSALKVEDVMTKPVITVMEDESLGVATTRMIKDGLKRLPVTDANGTLVGILSRLDVLKQVTNEPLDVPQVHIPTEGVHTVKEIMQPHIPIVHESDDLITIIEKFSLTHSHRLIVVNSSGKAIGLISDADVVARVQPLKRRSILNALKRLGKPPVGEETALDLMSAGLLTVKPDLPVVNAVQQMLSLSRKWLVVVDTAGKPLGLVDRQILLEAVIQSYPSLNDG